MEAGKRTLTDIFNPGRSLRIPFFQRGYVWDTDNWERLLSDCIEISENKKDYFLGSIILKSISTPSNERAGDWRSVIDGQQRLTTLLILYRALLDINSIDSMYYERLFYNLASEITLKQGHMDEEIFRAITTGNLTEQLEQKYKGNKILKCYNYFKSRKEDISKIDTQELTKHIYFVGIDLSKDEDEQQIFDTINSLGVRLTVAELLKNHLFSAEKDMDMYNSTWKKTFEADEDVRKFWDMEVSSGRTKRTNIDLLLQSYFTIKSYGEEFKVSEMFQEYKKYIEQNNILSDISQKENFVSELISYADIYKKYINLNKLDSIDDKEPAFVCRMNVLFFKLDMSTAIPYFLFVIKNISNDEKRAEIFALLESYFIRRFICAQSTRSYNRLIKSLIKENILSLEDLSTFLRKRANSDDAFPNDVKLASSFNSQELYNITATGILYLLELGVRNVAKQQTLLKGINCYDLEHIMPKKWKENWKLSYNTEEERKALEEKRNTALKTLGNMTILTKGLNRSMHNVDWNTKKNGTIKWEGLKKFGEGIETFSSYIQLEKWDEEEIAKRGNDLLKFALQVWPSI